MNRNYSGLLSYSTYYDRLRYLVLEQGVSDRTFGGLRTINQSFYRSREWKNIRNLVITRDYGCDLALKGHTIIGSIYVHHIIPITPKVLSETPEIALDPEYLITVSFETHQLIHFGKVKDLYDDHIERYPGDTKLW